MAKQWLEGYRIKEKLALEKDIAKTRSLQHYGEEGTF